MPFDIKTAKVIGDLGGSKWSQVVAEGNLLLLLEVAPSENVSAEAVGKSLLDNLLLKIHQSEINSLSSLKALFSSAAGNSNIASLIIGVVVNDVLYLAVKEGRVVIRRGGKIIKLVEGEKYISGFIQKGDYFLFSSRSFNRNFTYSREEDIFRSARFEEITEIIAPLILEKEDSSGYAALVVSFSGFSSSSNLDSVQTVKEPAPFPAPFAFSKQKILSLFQSVKLSLLSPKEDTILSPEQAKSQKTLFTVAAVLIALLLLSIFFGINNSSNKTRSADFNSNIEIVSHQIDEAAGLLDLNPGRSRDLIREAKATLETLQKQFNKGSNEYKNIQLNLDKLNQLESQAVKVYKLTSVPAFFDISFLRTDGTGSAMSLYNSDILILDGQNKVIYKLSIGSKRSEIVSGKDFVKDAKLIGIHGGSGFILNSDGIESIDIGAKSGKVIIKKDPAWGDIGSLVAFGGNLYLLDKTHNQIDKYIATSDGFTERQNYLNSDVKVDFSNASSMAIDGSVWVQTGNNIAKFTQGRPDQFSPTGLVTNFVSVSQIYTDDNDKSIYLLDRGQSQIIVLGKDGAYQSSYEWSGLKNAASFVVSEDEKKIFVLSGSKIYAIDIK